MIYIPAYIHTFTSGQRMNTTPSNKLTYTHTHIHTNAQRPKELHTASYTRLSIHTHTHTHTFFHRPKELHTAVHSRLSITSEIYMHHFSITLLSKHEPTTKSSVPSPHVQSNFHTYAPVVRGYAQDSYARRVYGAKDSEWHARIGEIHMVDSESGSEEIISMQPSNGKNECGAREKIHQAGHGMDAAGGHDDSCLLSPDACGDGSQNFAVWISLSDKRGWDIHACGLRAKLPWKLVSTTLLSASLGDAYARASRRAFELAWERFAANRAGLLARNVERVWPKGGVRVRVGESEIALPCGDGGPQGESVIIKTDVLRGGRWEEAPISADVTSKDLTCAHGSTKPTEGGQEAHGGISLHAGVGVWCGSTRVSNVTISTNVTWPRSIDRLDPESPRMSVHAEVRPEPTVLSRENLARIVRCAQWNAYQTEIVRRGFAAASTAAGEDADREMAIISGDGGAGALTLPGGYILDRRRVGVKV
jgi:hypothetical protein